MKLPLVKKRIVEGILTREEVKRFEKKYKWYKVYLNPESGSRKFIRYAFFWNVINILMKASRKEGKF